MYITVAQADSVVGIREGWANLTVNDKAAFLIRASNRLDVIPFETDPLPAEIQEQVARTDDRLAALEKYEGKIGRSRTKERWTDGFAENGSPIPRDLVIATSDLALWYSRNPLTGYNRPFPEEVQDSRIHPTLQDLPLTVQNALWAYLHPIFKSGVTPSQPFDLKAEPETTSVREPASPLSYS